MSSPAIGARDKNTTNITTAFYEFIGAAVVAAPTITLLATSVISHGVIPTVALTGSALLGADGFRRFYNVAQQGKDAVKKQTTDSMKSLFMKLNPKVMYTSLGAGAGALLHVCSLGYFPAYGSIVTGAFLGLAGRNMSEPYSEPAKKKDDDGAPDLVESVRWDGGDALAPPTFTEHDEGLAGASAWETLTSGATETAHPTSPTRRVRMSRSALRASASSAAGPSAAPRPLNFLDKDGKEFWMTIGEIEYRFTNVWSAFYAFRFPENAADFEGLSSKDAYAKNLEIQETAAQDEEWEADGHQRTLLFRILGTKLAADGDARNALKTIRDFKPYEASYTNLILRRVQAWENQRVHDRRNLKQKPYIAEVTALAHIPDEL